MEAWRMFVESTKENLIKIQGKGKSYFQCIAFPKKIVVSPKIYFPQKMKIKKNAAASMEKVSI